jgi:hypothetical protein
LASRLFRAGLPAAGALPAYLFSVFSVIFLQFLINHLLRLFSGAKLQQKNHLFPMKKNKQAETERKQTCRV